MGIIRKGDTSKLEPQTIIQPLIIKTTRKNKQLVFNEK